MYTILVLAEETLTDHDVARIATLHDPEPVAVHLLVPAERHRNRLVERLDDLALGRVGEAVREGGTPPEQEQVSARNALDTSLSALRSAGVEADGELVDDPVAAAVDRARSLDVDEIIVVTEPHLVEETFHRDWASRLRHKLKRPVLHVVAGTDRVL